VRQNESQPPSHCSVSGGNPLITVREDRQTLYFNSLVQCASAVHVNERTCVPVCVCKGVAEGGAERVASAGRVQRVGCNTAHTRYDWSTPSDSARSTATSFRHPHRTTFTTGLNRSLIFEMTYINLETSQLSRHSDERARSQTRNR
jgi:hypothetical protein